MNSARTSINLKELTCARLELRLDSSVRVQRFSRWGCELATYMAPQTLYLPGYCMQVWNGFSPLEAVNYEFHFGMARNSVPQEQPIFDLREAERSELEVCILSGPCTRTFGHWAEELLKVLILEEAGFRGKYVLAPSPQAIWFESLALLGVEDDRIMIVERPTVFAAAAFTTVIHHFVAHRFPGVFSALRDRLYAAVGHASGKNERIWIARGAGAQRGSGDVLNQGNVDEIVKHYGFESLDVGQLTFAQQIAVDRDVRIVAGPHGSAFVHVGFMRNGAGVLEIFSPHYINPSVIQLCLAFGHSYRQMIPANTPHEPYAHPGILVDTDHLQLVLQELCGGA